LLEKDKKEIVMHFEDPNYKKLKIWNKIKSISWTPKEWDVVSWSLDRLAELAQSKEYLEDNPDFLTNEGLQWEEFWDDMERLLDMTYEESESEYRSKLAVVRSIMRKLNYQG